MLMQPAYMPDLFQPAVWAPVVALGAGWAAVSSLGVALGLGLARRLRRLP